jgi:hypothetical protein
LCPACRPGHRQVVSVTAATIQVLRQFAACDSDTWRDVTWDARTCGELRGVLNQYVCRLLDHRPRMHAYLGLLGHATR